jgi:hypothetical protein
MSDEIEERQLSERRHVVDALAAELDVQRQSFIARSSSMNTRLSILVAAASLTSGLQVASHQSRAWLIVAVCLSAAGAVCGVFALLPRTGGENGIEALQAELWNETPARAAYLLLHRKLEILKDDEKSLHRKRWLAIAGFAFLAMSIVSVAIQIIES